MKRILIIVGALLVVAAIAGSTLKGRDKAEARVEVGKVEAKDLTAIVDCSGTIEPKRKVDVSANAMGTIVKLAVAEGQHVDQGDLLMEIDPSAYKSAVDALQASIRSARADLELSEASADKANLDLERAEKLHKEELASDEQLANARTSARMEKARAEAARNRVKQLEANLASARHDLDKVTITAPMTGVITRRNVEEGENAIMGTLNNPGTVLLVIADLGTMEAWVEVDETEVVDVALGQTAKVTIDAFPDSTFTGHVTEIGNSPIRTRTGGSQEAIDFQVKITLDGTMPNIRPGLSAKAEINVAERKQVLAVPLGAVTVRDFPLRSADVRRYAGRRAKAQEKALKDLGFVARSAKADTTGDSKIKRKETEGVFVMKDGFVKFVPVKIGIAGENDFEVTSGLTAGQTVVTGPFRILRELKEGAHVELQKKGKDGKGRGGQGKGAR